MRPYVLFATLVSAMAALGCSFGRSAPPSSVYPVTGTVTYKGKPVIGADITFYNDSENRSAFGRTNDRGEYQLTTFSANDGAVPGKHLVTIVKIEPPAAPRILPDVDSPEYVPPGLGQNTMPAPPKATFPEKYGNQQTSGLLAVVSADAPNRIDFNLTD